MRAYRQAPDLGDAWKFGCPESPMWESEGEAWSEDKRAGLSESFVFLLQLEHFVP